MVAGVRAQRLGPIQQPLVLPDTPSLGLNVADAQTRLAAVASLQPGAEQGRQYRQAILGRRRNLERVDHKPGESERF